MTKKSVSFLSILLLLAVFIPFIHNFGFDLVSERAVDFPAYYYATKLAFEEDLTPYHPVHWQQAKALSGIKGDFWPFVYPPPSLFLFKPMISLEYEQAKIVMLVINYLLIFVFLYLFFIKILQKTLLAHFTLFGVIYLFSFNPLSSTIRHGQINLFILVLMCLTWFGLREKNHPALVAIPLTLAIFLKITPALFLIYLFIKNEYKVLVWVMLLLLFISVCSFFILPDEIWKDWYHSVAQHGYGTTILGLHPGSPANQSVNGFIYRFIWGRGPVNMLVDDIISLDEDVKKNVAKLSTYSIVCALSFITFLLLLLNSKLKSTNSTTMVDIEISMVLVLMFLVSPFSWDHHLVILLPAIYTAVRYIIIEPIAWLLRVIIVFTILLLAFDYPFQSPIFWEGFNTLFISMKFFAVGIIWFLFAFAILKNIKKAPKQNQLYRKKQTL